MLGRRRGRVLGGGRRGLALRAETAPCCPLLHHRLHLTCLAPGRRRLGTRDAGTRGRTGSELRAARGRAAAHCPPAAPRRVRDAGRAEEELIHVPNSLSLSFAFLFCFVFLKNIDHVTICKCRCR